jgi:hypothetical protein
MYRTDLTSSDESGCLVPSGLGQPAEESTGAAWFPSEREGCGNQARSSASGASKGTFLDPTIVLRGAVGASLVEAVMEQFAAHRELRRRRHAREVENEQHLLGCMLANGLRCRWHRATPLVAYQRKVDAVFYAELNRPKWLSAQALGRAVALLSEGGLVERHVGERGTSSGYSVTGKLLTLAETAGVSEQSLGRSLQREDLVQLKGLKPRPIFDPFTRKLVRQRADRIYFEPTLETEKWCHGLTSFNDFIAAQDIAVDLSDDLLCRWVAELNDDELHIGAKLCRPELFRDAVYRVFTDGNPDKPAFEKGGRLVGGWWINAPEEVRRHIKMNGEPTVELDYSACHPRILYHEQGLEPPSDLYEVPEVIDLEQRNGCEAGAYRPLVKWLTQILINGRGRPDQVPVPRGMILPRDVPLRDITAFIRRRHEPISSAFGSRAGLRLMKTESDIAFAVVTNAKQGGWLALPVHDSFIAQTSRVEELRKMMVEEYKHKLSYEPTIDIK